MPQPIRLFALSLAGALALSGTGCASLFAKAPAKAEVAPVALTQEEADVFNATNEFRKANNLPELKPDVKLVALARQRSRDMAARDYFSHVSPEGGDVFASMRDERITYWAAGENLARNNFPAETSAAEAMDGWRKSPEHRANLLHPAFGHIGVGVAKAKDGKAYITEVFTD
ncbi:MAG: hypothetical protein JWM80_454 [Cyanobacteria bacterium RYN_339]|nr:hypothetical protein [Cyanobacteria bacterium RYN_339]